MIWQAQMELAQKAWVIENTYSTTTVVGTREYQYPTTAIAIRRVTYNGRKLEPINQREDDAITGSNEATTSTGTPLFYYVWDGSIFLRPTPDDDLTLKVFSYDIPGTVTSVSTLETPTVYHADIITFCLREMCAKDKNYQGAQYHAAAWAEVVRNAVKLQRKRRRADANANAMSQDLMPETVLGTV